MISNKAKKITIVGAGYVGMSIAAVLSQLNEVTILDIDHERVNKVNNNKSTVYDEDINNFLTSNNLNLQATTNKNHAYKDADYIIIATPTNFDEKSNYFDTSAVDSVISDIFESNLSAVIIIKSTIPVGYTNSLKKKYKTSQIIFSPEFLREGKALMDNLYPSRIIIGSLSIEGRNFANLLKEGAIKENIECLFMDSNEAESVKLFANTFLAMRVSFFNELDSFALTNKLNTKDIIKGISLDERIGDIYNNPSFGYGGYCLPKDTKQLLASYENTPQNLMQAIVQSNETRKNFLSNEIAKLKPEVIGFYRLVMKEGSDNLRHSAILDIFKLLKNKGFEIIVFEPLLTERYFEESTVIESLDEFKIKSELIVTNRLDSNLLDVKNKCFSRDLFNIN